ncbi:UNVERIFIED_CONTAM: hypothetical protein HDU68_011615 [Siphonaria sp. JEL0065]|nr:hypothetical protein HDU68_011615 [Siphonaria sp. JEL0065]
MWPQHQATLSLPPVLCVPITPLPTLAQRRRPLRTASRWVGKSGGIPDMSQKLFAPGGRHQGGGGCNGVVVGGSGVVGVGGGSVGGRVGGSGVGICDDDVMGSISFIKEMGSALASARERPVQVVSINARTQQTVGGGALTSTADVNVVWPGFLTDKKTLFIHVPCTASFSSFLQPAQAGANGFGFRESGVSVLELAEDVLGVQSLVVCLDKDREDLATLVRSFLFVGFELVHPSVYDVTGKFVLVGSSF